MKVSKPKAFLITLVCLAFFARQAPPIVPQTALRSTSAPTTEQPAEQFALPRTATLVNGQFKWNTPTFQDQHNKTCPTIFHIGTKGTEHSPLIIRNPEPSKNVKDLVVCRVPKVGSTMLRALGKAIKLNRPMGGRLWGKFDTVDHENMTLEEFQYLMYEEPQQGVSRIMFVRHPVMRILSGALQPHVLMSEFIPRRIPGIAPRRFRNRRKAALVKPQEFAAFVFAKNGLTRDYKPNCVLNEGEPDNSWEVHKSIISSPHYVRKSTNSRIQHWAPPQQCRCGILECGTEFEVFHLERIPSIQEIIKEQLSADDDAAWMPPPEKRANAHHNKYADYLENATVLEFLNELTKPEQEYFGYLPLTWEQVVTGTVGLITDT